MYDASTVSTCPVWALKPMYARASWLYQIDALPFLQHVLASKQATKQFRLIIDH